MSFATDLFLKDRLQFVDGKQSAPFPSALVVYSGTNRQIQCMGQQFPDAHTVYVPPAKSDG